MPSVPAPASSPAPERLRETTVKLFAHAGPSGKHRTRLSFASELFSAGDLAARAFVAPARWTCQRLLIWRGRRNSDSRPVPRASGSASSRPLGGVLTLAWRQVASVEWVLTLVLCCAPAFVSGLVEDPPPSRSGPAPPLHCFVGTAWGPWLLDASDCAHRIRGWTGSPRCRSAPPRWPCSRWAWPTNSVNIIDGMNGPPPCVAIMLAGVGLWPWWATADRQSGHHRHWRDAGLFWGTTPTA